MKTKLTAFVAMLCLALTLCFGACSFCQHQYDNVCDSTCNLCEHTRKVSGHEYSAPTCSTPETCKHCSETTGLLIDCVPLVDDDCKTPVVCENCGKDMPHVVEQHNYVLTYTTNDDGHLVGTSACADCGNKENYTVTIVFDTSLFVATNLTGYYNEPVLKYTGGNATYTYTIDSGESQDTNVEAFLYADDECDGYYCSTRGTKTATTTCYTARNSNIGINVFVQSKQDVTVTLSVEIQN